MQSDPFFNPVSLQLIETPAASRKELEAAARGQARHAPADAFALESAKSWVREVLRDEYQPPASTPFLTLPAEEGACDVVRAAYTAGGYDIEVAQSRHILSIRFRGAHSPAGLSDLEKAQALAHKVFALGDHVRLETSGAFRGGSFGKQNTAAAGRIDHEWPHWLDELRWWADAGDVGFVAMKAAGGPTREVISIGAEANVHWFN